MNRGPTEAALAVARELRRSQGYRGLAAGERAALDADLRRIEQALGHDPYAAVLEDAPMSSSDDLRRRLSGGSGGANGAPRADARQEPPPPAPGTPPSTAQLGERAAAALEAVNFPGFVAALVTGTFQAIVDASARQIREYSQLVADLSRSVDDFSRDRVTANQARDWLAEHFPKELYLRFPEPGKPGEPQLLPRAGAAGESPPWLEQFGLGGQELTPELTDGALVQAGRRQVGEERMQTLATMVLMGINRVVVNDGEVKARMQFHATARDRTTAEANVQQLGIAGRAQQGETSLMVSTVKANAQADASIKADLVGEVRISFRSETFPLERFADSQAIQLINRHARWSGDAQAPATTTTPPPGGPKGGGTT